jgi:hypothetical protein
MGDALASQMAFLISPGKPVSGDVRRRHSSKLTRRGKASRRRCRRAWWLTPALPRPDRLVVLDAFWRDTKRLSHKPLRLSLLRPVEEPE